MKLKSNSKNNPKVKNVQICNFFMVVLMQLLMFFILNINFSIDANAEGFWTNLKNKTHDTKENIRDHYDKSKNNVSNKIHKGIDTSKTIYQNRREDYYKSKDTVKKYYQNRREDYYNSKDTVKKYLHENRDKIDKAKAAWDYSKDTVKKGYDKTDKYLTNHEQKWGETANKIKHNVDNITNEKLPDNTRLKKEKYRFVRED